MKLRTVAIGCGVLSCLAVGSCVVYWLKVATAIRQHQEATAEYPRNHMVVEFIDYRIVREYEYTRGAVHNTGPATVNYWKLAVKYYDKSGAVIDTDYTNSLERLGPGEKKEFELMRRYDESRPATSSMSVEEVRLE